MEKYSEPRTTYTEGADFQRDEYDGLTPSEYEYQQSDTYLRAKKRVKDIKGFYSHLFVYCLMSFFFFAINMLTTPNHLWFFWSILGWGIGVFAHAFRVFGVNGMLGKDWEEQKIREIMQKEDHKDILK